MQNAPPKPPPAAQITKMNKKPSPQKRRKHTNSANHHRKFLKKKERDLKWTIRETITLCHDLKHGIEDCYALLAPIDPGSTLVMSTHRNEKVKGTITRVGTRIIKGVRGINIPFLYSYTGGEKKPLPHHVYNADSSKNK